LVGWVGERVGLDAEWVCLDASAAGLGIFGNIIEFLGVFFRFFQFSQFSPRLPYFLFQILSKFSKISFM